MSCSASIYGNLKTRSLYHITIYRLYRYSGYTILIVSFILVPWYFKQHIFATNCRIFWWLEYRNLWIYQVFWGLKPDKNVLLIHIEYRFMYIVIYVLYRLNKRYRALLKTEICADQKLVHLTDDDLTALING